MHWDLPSARIRDGILGSEKKKEAAFFLVDMLPEIRMMPSIVLVAGGFESPQIGVDKGDRDS